jgi:hypothetical protein
MTRFALALSLLVLVLGPGVAAQDPPKISQDDLDFFESRVRPILSDRCYKCHTPKTIKVKDALTLDTRDGWAKKGVIVPGDPDKSRLIYALRWTDPELSMPPSKKLPDKEIDTLVEWIKRGAPDPRTGGPAPAPPTTPHWAWQPPKDSPGKSIDDLVAARLGDLKPAPPADRRTLIRRATFDLTGLPPTPEDVDAFVADDAPDAFEKLLDRLLASPAYGERWGRAWLDVARYADTKGYVFEEERRFPYAYAYRDWVIRAFNDDLPYDRFLMLQIAADRLAVDGDVRDHAAMGFLTVGRRFLNNVPDIIDDRIDVVTRGTMALTVSCARCHDHKYDPIPTADYYALYGVFDSSPENPNPPRLPTTATPEETRAFEEELAKRERAVADLRERRHKEIVGALRKAETTYVAAAKEARDLKDDARNAFANDKKLNPHALAKWVEAVRKNADAPVAPDFPLADADALFTPDDHNKVRDVRRRVDELKVTHPGAPPHAMSLVDSKPHDVRVFLRGNPGSHGPVAPRAFPKVLGGQRFKDGSGRLELARAIASKGNPLTARVWVNRVWAHHFGAALVRTPSDFGTRCEPPTHPELLDWLALRFVEDGWSTKKLHRRIMLSATYRQSSGSDDRDPENRLLARMNRRRLDFESMRDAMLAVSGALDARAGGPASPIDGRRRTVYAQVERQNLPGVFRTFDFASPDVHSPRRFTTTIPQQALFLMNSPFATDRARELAKRAEGDLQKLYRLALGRSPTDDERSLASRFLESEAARKPDPVAEKSFDWQHGYGSPRAFKALPHFTGDMWRGGGELPDKKIGWVLLTATGGHPGAKGIAAIRRWTAPRDGVIAIAGSLEHPDAQGDGVKGRIVSSAQGELAAYVVAKRRAETAMTEIPVRKGETIDFVVECRENEHCDSFSWAPVVRMGEEEWSAQANFAGPRSPPLSPFEKLSQVLMMSNEFHFVD